MELQPSDVEAKQFDVAKKGYDREQVDEFLRLVGREMSGMQERAKIAVVRAEQLELKMHELRATTRSTGEIYEDALRVKRRIIAEAEEEAAAIRAVAEHAPAPAVAEATETAHGTARSQQLIEDAMARAATLEAEAEAVLERALAASDRIEGETEEILAAARGEAAALIAAAQDDANDVRREARSGQSDLHLSLLEEERELTVGVRHLHAAAAALESAAATAPTPAAEEAAERQGGEALAEPVGMAVEPDVVVDVTEDDEKVTVDLTDEPKPTPSRRTTRYMSRSARLPHIGEDAESVLGSMDSLRLRDDKK